jgi:hypothetical protein
VIAATALWKGVEKKENAMGVRRGCAGHCEDPDRSVSEEDVAEEKEVSGDSEETREGN